jgi:hypothetical protein
MAPPIFDGSSLRTAITSARARPRPFFSRSRSFVLKDDAQDDQNRTRRGE